MEMSRRITEILWLGALAIGADLQRLIETYVEACQEQPVAEVVETVAPVQDGEPVITDAIVPFVRPTQPVTSEAALETVTIDWSILIPMIFARPVRIGELNGARFTAKTNICPNRR